MKFVLLALFVAVASANMQQKHTRQWRSVRTAANNIEKIQENGELRGFFTDIICEGVDCASATLNFWMKNNGQCQKFSVVGNKIQGSEDYNAEFSGQNVFTFCHQSKNLLVFCFQNTDVNGLVTDVVHAAVRPGHRFNKEDQIVYTDLVKQHGINEENILNIESADICRK
ncbi:lipocalin Cav p 3.0101-like [Sorex fumeus]|uniref:lipocalin Cav p 3.0101-like n=1 Tax=Sorex fumeus TaxID=62283 RepID=UPI0024ACE867|nr:lipocalin Cav p 3.0101-like [Sorex fumeus]